MRRYIVESLGTFFLAFAVCFTSFTGNPIPVGLMFMAMIYIGLHISGAHYNPVFSLAAFLQDRMDMATMCWYMASQCFGAFLSIGLFSIITDIVFSPEIPMDAPLTLSMGMEFLLSFVLILTMLTVTLVERYKGHVQGLIMGLTLTAVVSIGGIFNPAIALAAVFMNILKDGMFVGLYPVMIYIVSPFLASLAATYTYNFLNENHRMY
ncbi:MAG TPA: aquaporin [Candidatus Babeliales bacterium]|jgi:aquaporin Z|nr:aquaporin [Candidatus Babeliales bacterium]